MNAFDAECEFVIEMNGAKVTKQVVNIYKSLGEDKVQQVFIDDIDLIALSRSGSIEDLCTCMICYGKEENGVRTTIESIEYDDGRYYSPKGHIRIYDREAHQNGQDIVHTTILDKGNLMVMSTEHLSMKQIVHRNCLTEDYLN